MGKPKAPKPPDPVQTASAQTASNISTAIAQQRLNNMNQVTPDGRLTYEQTGTDTYTNPLDGKTYDIPIYTATQTLSPVAQAIKDRTDQARQNFANLAASQSGRLDGLLSEPIDTSGLPRRGDAAALGGPDFQSIGSGPSLQSGLGDAGDITRSYGTDFGEERDQVQDALLARLNPSLEKDRSALEARLASQGIRVGSEAYGSAMDDFGRQSNDARLAAILGAGQEHSRMAGLEAQRAGFENTAQQQAFGQEAARAGFGNAALQQEHQNQASATQANNSVEQQRFNADLSRMNAMDQARNQTLQEQFELQNQPINQIMALMSGSRVSAPRFVNTTPAQLANTDFAGIQANHNNAMQQQYQNKMSGWNTIWGGLGGLGGAYLGTL